MELGEKTKPLVESLEFRQVNFSVNLRAHEAKTNGGVKTKEVLHGVSGALKAGELMALMGPSGSGKTTLLNAMFMAQQGTLSSPLGTLTSGEVLVNGMAPSKASSAKAGFVFQDDLLLSSLTVRETVAYSAALRLPQSFSDTQRSERVEGVIAALRLGDCAETMVGSVIRRGVSGGERKRTAVACELVTRPGMLLMDEPTSGLDATSALSVVTVLSELAQTTGLLLICSIHQPRWSVFSLFDKLQLLSSGSTVFSGATVSQSWALLPPSALDLTSSCHVMSINLIHCSDEFRNSVPVRPYLSRLLSCLYILAWHCSPLGIPGTRATALHQCRRLDTGYSG